MSPAVTAVEQTTHLDLELKDKVKNDNSAAQYKISSEEHKSHHSSISTPPVYVVHNFIKEDQRPDADEGNLKLKRIRLPSTLSSVQTSTELFQVTDYYDEAQLSESETIDNVTEKIASSNVESDIFLNDFINTIGKVMKSENKSRMGFEKVQSTIDDMENNLLVTPLVEYFYNSNLDKTVPLINKNSFTTSLNDYDSSEIESTTCKSVLEIDESATLDKMDQWHTIPEGNDKGIQVTDKEVTYSTQDDSKQMDFNTEEYPEDYQVTNALNYSSNSKGTIPDNELQWSEAKAAETKKYRIFNTNGGLGKMQWFGPSSKEIDKSVPNKGKELFQSDSLSYGDYLKLKSRPHLSKFRALLANRQFTEESSNDDQNQVKEDVVINNLKNDYRLPYDQSLVNKATKSRKKRSPLVYSIMATSSKPNQLVVHRLMTTSKDGLKGTVSPGFFNLAENMMGANEDARKDAELKAFMGKNTTRNSNPQNQGDSRLKMQDFLNIGYRPSTERANYKQNLRQKFDNFDRTTPPPIFQFHNYMADAENAKDNKDPHQVFNIYILNKVKNSKGPEMVSNHKNKKSTFFNKMNIFKKFGHSKNEAESSINSRNSTVKSDNIRGNFTSTITNNVGTVTPCSFEFVTSSTKRSGKPTKKIKSSTARIKPSKQTTPKKHFKSVSTRRSKIDSTTHIYINNNKSSDNSSKIYQIGQTNVTEIVMDVTQPYSIDQINNCTISICTDKNISDLTTDALLELNVENKTAFVYQAFNNTKISNSDEEYNHFRNSNLTVTDLPFAKTSQCFFITGNFSTGYGSTIKYEGSILDPQQILEYRNESILLNDTYESQSRQNYSQYTNCGNDWIMKEFNKTYANISTNINSEYYNRNNVSDTESFKNNIDNITSLQSPCYNNLSLVENYPSPYYEYLINATNNVQNSLSSDSNYSGNAYNISSYVYNTDKSIDSSVNAYDSYSFAFNDSSSNYNYTRDNSSITFNNMNNMGKVGEINPDFLKITYETSTVSELSLSSNPLLVSNSSITFNNINNTGKVGEINPDFLKITYEKSTVSEPSINSNPLLVSNPASINNYSNSIINSNMEVSSIIFPQDEVVHSTPDQSNLTDKLQIDLASTSELDYDVVQSSVTSELTGSSILDVITTETSNFVMNSQISEVTVVNIQKQFNEIQIEPLIEVSTSIANLIKVNDAFPSQNISISDKENQVQPILGLFKNVTSSEDNFKVVTPAGLSSLNDNDNLMDKYKWITEVAIGLKINQDDLIEMALSPANETKLLSYDMPTTKINNEDFGFLKDSKTEFSTQGVLVSEMLNDKAIVPGNLSNMNILLDMTTSKLNSLVSDTNISLSNSFFSSETRINESFKDESSTCVPPLQKNNIGVPELIFSYQTVTTLKPEMSEKIDNFITLSFNTDKTLFNDLSSETNVEKYSAKTIENQYDVTSLRADSLTTNFNNGETSNFDSIGKTTIISEPLIYNQSLLKPDISFAVNKSDFQTESLNIKVTSEGILEKDSFHPQLLKDAYKSGQVAASSVELVNKTYNFSTFEAQTLHEIHGLSTIDYNSSAPTFLLNQATLTAPKSKALKQPIDSASRWSLFNPSIKQQNDTQNNESDLNLKSLKSTYVNNKKHIYLPPDPSNCADKTTKWSLFGTRDPNDVSTECTLEIECTTCPDENGSTDQISQACSTLTTCPVKTTCPIGTTTCPPKKPTCPSKTTACLPSTINCPPKTTTCPIETTECIKETVSQKEYTCPEETSCESDATEYNSNQCINTDEDDLHNINFKCTTSPSKNQNFQSTIFNCKSDTTKGKMVRSTRPSINHCSQTIAYNIYGDKKPKCSTQKKDKINSISTTDSYGPTFTPDEILSEENEFWRTVKYPTGCSRKAVYNIVKKLNDNRFLVNLEAGLETTSELTQYFKDNESEKIKILNELNLILTATDSGEHNENENTTNFYGSTKLEVNLQSPQDSTQQIEEQTVTTLKDELSLALLPFTYKQRLNVNEEGQKVISSETKQVESGYPEELKSKIMSKDFDTDSHFNSYNLSDTNQEMNITMKNESTNEFTSSEKAIVFDYSNTINYLNNFEEEHTSSLNEDVETTTDNFADLSQESSEINQKNFRRSYENQFNSNESKNDSLILTNTEATVKNSATGVIDKTDELNDYEYYEISDESEQNVPQDALESTNILNITNKTNNSPSSEEEIAEQIYLLSLKNNSREQLTTEKGEFLTKNIAFSNKDAISSLSNQIENESSADQQVIRLMDNYIKSTTEMPFNNDNSEHISSFRETIFEIDKGDKKAQVEDLRPNAFAPGRQVTQSKLSTTNNIKVTKGITLSPFVSSNSNFDDLNFIGTGKNDAEIKASSISIEDSNLAVSKLNTQTDDITTQSVLISSVESINVDGLIKCNSFKSAGLINSDNIKVSDAKNNIVKEKERCSAKKQIDFSIPEDRSEPEPDSLSNQIWDILTKAVKLQSFNSHKNRVDDTINERPYNSPKSSSSIFVNENTMSRFNGGFGKNKKELFQQKNKGRKIFGYIQKEFNSSKSSNGTDMNYYLSKLQIPSIEAIETNITDDTSSPSSSSTDITEDDDITVKSSTVKTIAEILKIDPLLRYILDLGSSRTSKPINSLSVMPFLNVAPDKASESLLSQIEKRSSKENSQMTSHPQSEFENWNVLVDQFRDSLTSDDYIYNDKDVETNYSGRSSNKSRRNLIEDDKTISNQTESFNIFSNESLQIPSKVRTFSNPIKNSAEINNFGDFSPNSLFYMYGTNQPLNIYSLKKRQRAKNCVFAKDTGCNKKFDYNLYEFSKGTYRPIRLRTKRESKLNEIKNNQVEKDIKCGNSDEDSVYTTTITSVRRTNGMRKIQEVVNPWEGGRKSCVASPIERRKISKILEAIESNNLEDSEDLIRCTDLSSVKKMSTSKQRSPIKNEAKNSTIVHKCKQARRKQGYLLNSWGKNNKSLVYPYYEDVENPIKGKCINSRPNTLSYNISESFFDKDTNGTALLCHVDLKITTKNYTLAPDLNKSNKYNCYYNLPAVSESGKPNVFVQYSPVYRSETNFSHAPQDYTAFLVKRVHKSLDQEYKYVVVNLNDIFYITVELNGDVYTYSDKSSPLRSRTVSKKLGRNKTNFKYNPIKRSEKRRRKCKISSVKKKNIKSPPKKRIKLDLLISEQSQPIL